MATASAKTVEIDAKLPERELDSKKPPILVEL
jgi:hypothetical protein